MKKYLLTFILCFMFIGSVSAVNVKGDVNIYWYDYDNYFKDRPDEVVIPFTANMATNNEDTREFTIKKDDCKVSTVYSGLDVWKCSLSFESYNYRFYEYEFDLGKFKGVPGYAIHDEASSGILREDGGITNLYLYKDVNRKITFTINYYDDNFRDDSRFINFDLVATNADYRYTFQAEEEKKDTYSFIYYVRAIENDEMNAENYMNKINYEIFDKYIMDNRKVVYNVDIDNGTVTIDIYHDAQKIDVPIKFVWNGKKADSVKLTAYNQKDEIEDEFDVSGDTTLKLFKNLKYSYGRKAIKYTLKAEDTDSHTYEVTKEGDTYIITGTYHGSEEKIENPKTNDNIIIYVSALIVCTIVIALTVRKIKK